MVGRPLDATLVLTPPVPGEPRGGTSPLISIHGLSRRIPLRPFPLVRIQSANVDGLRRDHESAALRTTQPTRAQRSNVGTAAIQEAGIKSRTDHHL